MDYLVNVEVLEDEVINVVSDNVIFKEKGDMPSQTKVVSPTEQQQSVVADNGYKLDEVVVNPIPLRKDEWGGYDWIIDPSFEKDQEFFFNGEYIKQVIVPMVREKNFISLANRTITNVNDRLIYTIGQYAFKGCVDLESINFERVETIEIYAFEGCTKLTKFNLPSIKDIKAYGFNNCSGIKEVYLPTLTTLGGYAFYNCKGIERVNLPNTTSIGQYSLSGLNSCKLIELNNITFPATLTQYFISTTGRLIINNVNMIYNGCFRTSQFSEIVLPQTNVVGMAVTGAFNGSSVANGTGFVYVPDDLVESYKTATNWTTFASQIKPISELPELA